MQTFLKTQHFKGHSDQLFDGVDALTTMVGTINIKPNAKDGLVSLMDPFVRLTNLLKKKFDLFIF